MCEVEVYGGAVLGTQYSVFMLRGAVRRSSCLASPTPCLRVAVCFCRPVRLLERFAILFVWLALELDKEEEPTIPPIKECDDEGEPEGGVC